MTVTAWVMVVVMQSGAPAPVDPDAPRPTAGPLATSKLPELVGDRGPEPPAPPSPGGVPGKVNVRNELGDRYRLVEASVALDGNRVAHVRAPAGQELQRNFTAYQGEMPPGRHAMSVTLVYEGRNAGVFSYMDEYKFRVQSSYAFDAQGDRPAAIDVVAKEKKGATVPLEKKPTMEINPAPNSGVVPVSTPAR